MFLPTRDFKLHSDTSKIEKKMKLFPTFLLALVSGFEPIKVPGKLYGLKTEI